MSPPSSKSRLKVTDCQDCGACCFHMGYPTYIHDSETQSDESHWTSMPTDLKTELLSYIDSYQPPPAGELDGPCCWFDMESRMCKHHEHRPNVCRDFQVGSVVCLEWRDVYRDKIKPGESQ